MGGTFEGVEATKNISKVRCDLKTVYFSIDIYGGNESVFDHQTVHKRFTNLVLEYLKSYGIKCEEEGGEGRGGGGTFIELIKYLWSQKELISIVICILKKLLSFLIKPKKPSRPRLSIILRFKSDSKLNYVQNKEIEYILSDKLVNLKNLSDELCTILKKKSKLFIIDQIFSVSLSNISFNIKYNICEESQNTFNRNRLVRLMQSIKVKNNFIFDVDFYKKYLIRRHDKKTIYDNGSWMSEKNQKTYYFLLSTKIIKDYFP